MINFALETPMCREMDALNSNKDVVFLLSWRNRGTYFHWTRNLYCFSIIFHGVWHHVVGSVWYSRFNLEDLVSGNFFPKRVMNILKDYWWYNFICNIEMRLTVSLEVTDKMLEVNREKLNISWRKSATAPGHFISKNFQLYVDVGRRGFELIRHCNLYNWVLSLKLS